jgi:hypothetical protein
MQVNVKTIIVVVLLSAFVWVFAERAVVKTAMVEIEIALISHNPEFVVQYLDEQGEPTAETSRRVKISVKGPAGRIQSLNEGKLTPRTVRSDIETEKFTNLAGQEFRDFTPRVLDLLDGKVTFEDQDAYLVAEDAKPAVLPIRVTKLLRVTLNIKVVDENNIPLPRERIESIEPEQIQAYVAGGTTNDAVVILNTSQQQKATQQPITVSARIPGLARLKEENEIKIKLVKETTIRPVETIPLQRIRVGIAISPKLASEYRVKIEDLEARKESYSPIRFQGPPLAVEEYNNATFHLILVVKEEDINTTNPARPLRYNLPDGDQQIQIIRPLNLPPVRFQLEKINN